MIRLVLAATLSANYGIYGPAFELMENGRASREARSTSTPRSTRSRTGTSTGRTASGSSSPGSTASAARTRRLQTNCSLRFHDVDNDQIICYSKRTGDGRNTIITVVNLDPRHGQSGWVDLPIADWGIADDDAYQVHDLLRDARYRWQGRRNYVELNPNIVPAHILRLAQDPRWIDA